MTQNINLENLIKAQGFSISGISVNTYSGWSVSGAGDVNGDGYDDIIIGAPECVDSSPCSTTGNSYVIYGGNDLNDINLINLTSTQGFLIYGAPVGGHSGFSVSRVGDIDNDTYADIIIGAPWANSNTGQSYVIYGGASLPSSISLATLGTQGISISGAPAGSYSGISVSGAGDVNNDGYDDIIIGAYGAFSYKGISYVIYGGPSLSSSINLASLGTQGFSITGVSVDDYSGSAVSGAGDVDGDGYDDVIIGAYNAGSGMEGQAYVIYGGASLSSIILPPTASQGFATNQAPSGSGSGSAVSGAGDVDGDGYADVIIGARYANSNTGQSYVIYGGASLPSSISLTNLGTQGISISGAPAGSYSGFSVSDAGDINGDGYADIIIGAPYADPSSRTNAGVSYVIYGGASLPSSISILAIDTYGFSISGAIANSYSGYSVSNAGDINNDTFADIIIGAFGANSNIGESYIIYGAESGFVTSTPTSSPTSSPTVIPTATPTEKPSTEPTNLPSFQPTSVPTNLPSMKPTGGPTSAPSAPPSASPTVIPSTIPSAKPTTIPTASPSSVPTERPTSFPSTTPTSEPSSEPTSYPTGEPTSSPTGYPTSNPTSQPTSEPTQPRVLNQSINYSVNALQGALSSLASIVGTFLFYKTILYILDKGGYEYKFIYDDAGKESLKSNQIGLYLDSSSKEKKLLAIHKQTYYQIEIGNGNNKGIPEGLYNFIVEQLSQKQQGEYYSYYPFEKIKYVFNDEGIKNLKENEIGIQFNPGMCSYLPMFCNKGKLEALHKINQGDLIKRYSIEIDDISNGGISRGLYHAIASEYKALSSSPFLISEQNQLRDFLLTNQRIHYDLYCCIPSYQELGTFRGILYYMVHDSVKQIKSHHALHRQDIRVSKESFAVIKQIIEHKIYSEDFNRAYSAEIGPETENPMSMSFSMKNINEKTQDKQDLEEQIETNNKENVHHSHLSIDALMDPEYARFRDIEFTNFGNNLMFFAEELPQDISKYLTVIMSKVETLFLEAPKESQTDMLSYKTPLPDANIQFSSSDDLMISLLSARQIIEYLPLIKYMMQGSINHFGANITLPEVLDNKAFLTTTHLILGNAAAQYLPAESIMNGIFISTASTASYAVRLIAAEYLKNQETSEDPIEFAQRCASTIVAYSLPGVVNYAITKAILPDAKMSISTLDILGSSSFGVTQCYNNYKAVYGAEAKATTTDIVVPYIADAITLWSLRGYLNFDNSNTANFMISVKNAMSVAVTVYATDCMARVIMDFVPQEVKEEYVDSAFNFASNAINDIASICYQSATDVSAYIAEEVTLIVDYMGAINLREDA